MRLPLKYNVASVTQRKLRSLLTILGVGMAIFLAVLMTSLSRGLLAATLKSGEDSSLLVLSKGADSMEFSALDPAIYSVLRSCPEVQLDSTGVPLASPEVLINTNVASSVQPDAQEGRVSLGLVRGILPVAWQVHPQVKVIEGRKPERGNELCVGSIAATKLGLPQAALELGRSLHFEGQDWTVVGRFAAPGTVFESEMWTSLDDFMVAAKREDYSSVVLMTGGQTALEDLLFDLQTRTDIRVSPHIESEYYAALANQLKPVQLVSLVMTVILVLGGLMAGMNTMFNSIAGRVRELAVLLVLGYRRRDVLLSFVLESLLLCLVGGLLGSGAGFVLSGLPMKIPMGAFRFVVDIATLAFGLGMALVIGVLGALLPVSQVARLSVVEGLRGK
jgi:ABC-type antimicrobial peptide transport system permease subunit